MTRRIQVRAWNNRAPSEEHFLPSAGAVEVVAAHLFGLFVGLRLPDFARAIRRSVQARRTSAERHLNTHERELLHRDAEVAEEHLARRSRRPIAPDAQQRDAQIDVETERGTIEVDLSTPLMTLTRQLCRADTVGVADEIVQKADAELSIWEASRRAEIRQVREIVMPFGVELRVPAEFEPRR